MTFAIITPALIVGAFAERMKFSAMLVFMALWFTLVYTPVAHMVWGGNGALMWDWGVLDFAGGTVVHINAGIAGLVACLVLGKRRGYPTTAMPPHNLNFTIMGASMLWVGWFGFNAGSAVAANQSAGMAMAGHPDCDRYGGAGVDVRRVADPWQTKRAGHRLRRCRRSGGDYSRVGHCGADGGAADWPLHPAWSVSSLPPSSSGRWVTTIHWMCSAFTAVGGILGAILTGLCVDVS
jgi:hypothetical protein